MRPCQKVSRGCPGLSLAVKNLLELRIAYKQLGKMNEIHLRADVYVRLLNKPYVNGVNLREQNLSLKCC